jgi:hypothetical protein
VRDAPNDFAVLITSSDKYADLWCGFFSLFWRYWPDCPFKIYLVSNTIGLDDTRVTNILVGPDKCWTDTMLKCLPRMRERHLLIWGEDLFLCRRVDSRRVIEICRWVAGVDANYMRLNAVPRPDKRCNRLAGVVSRGTLYRASTTVTLWKREVLLNLLTAGETGAVFEQHASMRSDAYDGFYSTWRAEVVFVNTVIKGKWNRSALRKVEQLGVPVDLSRRRVMTRREMAVLQLLRLRFWALSLFPAQWRRRIKHALVGGKYDYRYDEALESNQTIKESSTNS